MTISIKDWTRFVQRLGSVSKKAADELRVWVNKQGGLISIDRQALIDYAYALATKYGEGTSALAAAWYDAVAEASGKFLPPAEAAATATYAETAKTVNGVLKTSDNVETVAGAVERLVKMAGVDTTVKNAIRDGAQVAWIPHGDTCAFCLTLASRDFEPASKELVQNGHAAHVHANCDCTYAVRYDDYTTVQGYDPERYLQIYDSAEGYGSQQKINAMRREFYAENKARINAQKRDAYARRRALESSAAEELDT